MILIIEQLVLISIVKREIIIEFLYYTITFNKFFQLNYFEL